jgi:putative glutamine amidotransferase
MSVCWVQEPKEEPLGAVMVTIGITCSHFEMPQDKDNVSRLNRYVAAVEAAGARARMLWIPADGRYAEHASRVADEIDGLLISGGADLDPAMYGEVPWQEGHIELIRPQRPAWELPLTREFADRGKPILGICYGCQLLNVWGEGTLVQDIPTQWPDPIDHSGTRHGVHLLHGSRLSTIIGGEEFVVESSHHQAIKWVSPQARLCAASADGVAEALEWKDESWIFGVQWHPERDPESLATQRLFRAFVQAAGPKLSAPHLDAEVNEAKIEIVEPHP